jgi:hypothetical protein
MGRGRHSGFETQQQDTDPTSLVSAKPEHEAARLAVPVVTAGATNGLIINPIGHIVTSGYTFAQFSDRWIQR